MFQKRKDVARHLSFIQAALPDRSGLLSVCRCSRSEFAQ